MRYHIVESGRLSSHQTSVRGTFESPMRVSMGLESRKAEFNGKNRQDEMIRQRRKLWQGIDKWLGSIRQRSTCILAGDFNCSLLPEAAVCGPGIMPNGGAHPDQATFQALARAHRCCALNSWAGGGISARTYVPPNATSQHGSQIDYILLRSSMVDPVAKTARPFIAEFIPKTGCRHLPV